MADLVRPSRDGDQFHYLWAARRCLLLLPSPSQTGLAGITIEGASPEERPRAVGAGDAVIDVAEYYGDIDMNRATRIRYVQLKHSTRRRSQPWTASGLKRTLEGFAARYGDLLGEFTARDLKARFEFRFVTNRPVSVAIKQTVQDAAERAIPRYPREAAKLERITGLAGTEFSLFCGLIRFEDQQNDYWDQRNILFREVSGHLPDADVDAPVQLAELVRRKALSESEDDSRIEKTDVLRALGTDESGLYPAPCLLTLMDNPVSREQEAGLIQAIVEAEEKPVVVHALAGVGKSVFATRIEAGLPKGSVTVLYDCFGHGQYRSPTGSRHRHRDGLVQIANELAGRGLCHPLIPSGRADRTEYMRAFVHRLEQANKLIRRDRPEALLCVVVDAADNAQQAAEENGQQPSFARDLLRQTPPCGVRFVVLCRSHRQELLDPPPGALRLELVGFSATETAAHLRRTFPDASDHDVGEFHHFTSGNPRLQALALSGDGNRDLRLPEALRRLGPDPATVDDAIEKLLNGAVARLVDDAGTSERESIHRVCAGLAALRPLVPISVLSRMSGVSAPAIRSFVLDLGAGLLLAGDSVQFRDEPVETWFRTRFTPAPAEMPEFIGRLRSLADTSAYVASILPKLLLEAGQLSELVELTLTSSALPETNLLERRDVEHQRAQFALKASLRSRRYGEAAKLALKAGWQTAGDGRQRKLIQSNTDLAARFLDPALIEEMVTRRPFESGWLGAHHAYEAGLLSGVSTFAAAARSRLRMAYEWLDNWRRLSPEERRREEVSDADIAELAMAQLNIHGPDKAAAEICRWKPRKVAYRVGRLVARRLIDHGRVAHVNAVAASAGADLRLVLAVVVELREIQQTPPASVVDPVFRRVYAAAERIGAIRGSDREWGILNAISALVEAALRLSLCSRDEAAVLLTRCLPTKPPRGMADRFSITRFSLLRDYCLRAMLEGKAIEVADLAHEELKAELEKPSFQSSREAVEFVQSMGALLPWYQLWAAALLGELTKDELPNRVARLRNAAGPGAAFHYADGRHVSGAIASAWFDVLHLLDALDAESVGALTAWIESLRRPLFTPALGALARLGARRKETAGIALRFAAQTFELIRGDRADAYSKSDGYIDAARAVIAINDGAEARAYFEEAVAVSSKVGEENVARWTAMLDLADGAARGDRAEAGAAYRFARCAELTWDHVARDKHFDWPSTIEALTGLCCASSFAILSRWRDRGFGWTVKVLPLAAQALVKRGGLDPRDALPLIAFDGRWNHAALLDATLSGCASPEERETATSVLYRYMVLSGHGASTYSELQDVAAGHRLSIPDLKARIAFAERDQQVAPAGSGGVAEDGTSTPDLRTTDWDEIFCGNELTTVDGIARSRTAFRRTDPPWSLEEFFAEAVRRVAAGAEPEFIRAVCGTPDFSLYCLRDLLAEVPEVWRNRPSVMRSLADGIRAVCRRDCMKVAKHRYWQLFPFDGTVAVAGVAEAEVIDVVLDAVGESAEFADAERLFSLVGLLASKLDRDQAFEALTFALDLFDSVLEDRDGDGRWSDELTPPATVQESMAGYIYAGLGAPQAAVRWEAAHAVVGLCALNRTKVLRHLVGFADGRRVQPFTDAGLPFYGLHAFQWLMIAFARAATQYPAALAPFTERLAGWALEDEPHVMIRQFAARAALALVQARRLPSDHDLESRLRRVNVTSLPVVESPHVERDSHQPAAGAAEDDEDHWYFDMDIGPYWYKPLGEVFALPQHRIESEALKAIRNELHTSSATSWRDDERKRRDLYGNEGTHASHGSYQDSDDYQVYLSYHAMMVVAGRLLATTPTHHDGAWTEEDEFAEWLSSHDLMRNDGRWLADRRDPVPLEGPRWLDRKEGDPGYGIVTSADFDEALNKQATLAVWGSWSFASAEYVQSVRVRSALVAPKRSAALLRAVSTADNVHQYVIPSADYERQIDSAGFVLRGWLVDRGSCGDFDRKDEWSGDVSYPAPAPAAEIVELMAMETCRDGRVWRDAAMTPVMFSEVWGDVSRRGDDDNAERGNRLRASCDFLTKLLRRLDRDLIVEVQIERRRRRSRWRSDRRGEDDERTPTRARVYILTGDGHLSAL